RVLLAVRRHLLLVVAVTAFTAVAAMFAFKQPALYRAVAVIRLAGERRAVSASMEAATPLLDRNAGPVLSLLPLLRSRTIVGWVVDSLGLQVQPVPVFSFRHLLVAPPPPALRVRDVWVDPNTPGDTVLLQLTDSGATVGRRGPQWVHQRYGQPLEIGSARFTVPRPRYANSMVLLVRSRDVAIDQLLSRLSVAAVTGTDVVEVRYIDSDRDRAQEVPNLIVQTFQATSIRASQEQARRRRGFLAGQLRETERLLAKAHGSLSDFRSRRQIANSADQLELQQSTLAALDARRGDLEEDRRVYRSLLSQLESDDDSARVEGLRTLVYSPEIGKDPAVGRLYQQLLVYQTRLDSLTSGPYRSSANNPDVLQLNQLLVRAQGDLVRAVRAHLGSLEERAAAVADLRNANARTMRALPGLQAEEMRLNQQVTALSALGDQLRLEYEKSRMSEELEAGDIQIVDLASRPYRPVGVPWWVKGALATVLGLLLGGGLATLLEMGNRSIRAPEELAEMHLRGLGVIPRVETAPAS
ncbi:MAG: GumC family protein, partial [Actinomycetota bacterium]